MRAVISLLLLLSAIAESYGAIYLSIQTPTVTPTVSDPYGSYTTFCVNTTGTGTWTQGAGGCGIGVSSDCSGIASGDHCSVATVNSNIAAGERALFRGGTDYTTSDVLDPTNSGSFGNYIVLEGYSSETAKWDDNVGSGTSFFDISSDYVVVRNVELENGNVSTYGNGGPSNLRVEKATIHDFDVSAGSNSGGVRLDDCVDCYVGDSTIYTVTVAGSRNNDNSAAIQWYEAVNPVIEYNHLYDAYSCVFAKKAPAADADAGAIIRYNKCHDAARGVWATIAGGGNPNHVDFDVHNNVFWDLADNSIRVQGDSTVGQTTDIDFYQNTVDCSGIPSWGSGSTQRGALHYTDNDENNLYNNIFYDCGSSGAVLLEADITYDTEVIELDYNAYYPVDITLDRNGSPATHTTLTSIQQDCGVTCSEVSCTDTLYYCTPEENGDDSDPLFNNVSEGSEDFCLQSGSPLITPSTGKGGVTIGAHDDADGCITLGPR